MSASISLYYDDATRRELDAAMLVLKDVKDEVKLVELTDRSVAARVGNLAGCDELPMAALKGYLCTGGTAITYMAAAAAKLLPEDPIALMQSALVLEYYGQICSILSKCDVRDGQSRDRALTKDIPPICGLLEKTLTAIGSEEMPSESDTLIDCCVTSLWKMLTSEELYREGDFKTFYPTMTELTERYINRHLEPQGLCAACTGN